MSSALWWVAKGRAVAPPGIGCITGVSTSRKPRASRKARIVWMSRLRSRKTSRTPALTRRSTYRRRYRVSTSRRPCHFSGKGRTDFERKVQALTWTVSSPVRVRIRSPVTPTKSATSSSVKRA